MSSMKDNIKVLFDAVSNFGGCDKSLVNVLNKANNNKGVVLKDGGPSGNVINDHSKIRFGDVKISKMQYFTQKRPYATVPLGRVPWPN